MIPTEDLQDASRMAEGAENNGEMLDNPTSGASEAAMPNDSAPAEEQGGEESDGMKALQKEYDDLHNSYLRLLADHENYRKNVQKEKQSLLKYGTEGVLTKLLPIVDDFELAIKSLDHATDIEAVREGVHLIYKKFTTYLDQQGVKPVPAEQGDAFDDNIHDAMTMFPAPTPELKGKIVDCVTKGYKLGDKVIRYAKVVVGQ